MNRHRGFNRHHGFYVYIPAENITFGNYLCEEGRAWLENQEDPEWHLIDGIRPWPAAPQKPMVWFADEKLAAMFKLFFG
jgi:hypothetical protein